MWKNYIVFGLRHYAKNKRSFLISFLGLSVAILAVLLIGLYVIDASKHDINQSKADKIYRVEDGEWALMGMKYGEVLKDNFPEVKETLRFALGFSDAFLKNENNGVTTAHFTYVDTCIFNVFDFNFLYGNPKTALRDDFSVVLSESTARKLFGKKNPVGEQVRMSDMLASNDYTVTGVYEDMPHFHIQMDAFTNIETYKKVLNMPSLFQKFNSYSFPVYLVMNKPLEDKEELAARMATFLKNHPLNAPGVDYELLSLRPMNEIYFDYNGPYEHSSVRHGNKTLNYSLIGIGFLILLIACVNFVNLTIAKASLRYKEIGVRKVLGHLPNKVLTMVVTEVVLIATCSVMLGWLLMSAAVPFLNNISGINLSATFSLPLLALSIGVILLVSLLAGLPSAFSLAYINPILALKGGRLKEKGGMGLKSLLLGFQLLVSAILIVATTVLLLQFNFMKNKDLGINIDHTLVLNLNRTVLRKLDSFRNDVGQVAGVKDVISSTSLLTSVSRTESYGTEDAISCKIWNLEPGFEKMFDMELLAGRFFDIGDKEKSYLLNETALKAAGLSIDQYMEADLYKKNWKCVGVVKDFKYDSYHSAIAPLVIGCEDGSYTCYVKLDGRNSNSTIAQVEQVWNKYSPDIPMNVKMLNQYVEANYDGEKQLGEVFTGFSLLAVTIMLFGILGVVQFLLQRKTKEIAVRLILGADKKILIKDLSKPIALAIIFTSALSVPIVYYFSDQWLSGFTEHISFPYFAFALAFCFHLLVTFLMMWYHVSRIMKNNAMQAIRSE